MILYIASLGFPSVSQGALSQIKTDYYPKPKSPTPPPQSPLPNTYSDEEAGSLEVGTGVSNNAAPLRHQHRRSSQSLSRSRSPDNPFRLNASASSSRPKPAVTSSSSHPMRTGQQQRQPLFASGNDEDEEDDLDDLIAAAEMDAAQASSRPSFSTTSIVGKGKARGTTLSQLSTNRGTSSLASSSVTHPRPPVPPSNQIQVEEEDEDIDFDAIIAQAEVEEAEARQAYAAAESSASCVGDVSVAVQHQKQGGDDDMDEYGFGDEDWGEMVVNGLDGGTNTSKPREAGGTSGMNDSNTGGGGSRSMTDTISGVHPAAETPENPEANAPAPTKVTATPAGADEDEGGEEDWAMFDEMFEDGQETV